MTIASKRIAEVAGPTIVFLAFSEAINMGIFHDQSALVVYLSGTILFVTGLSLVRVHNRWQ